MINQDKRPSVYAAKPFALNDTRLFAALVSLGIPPVEGPAIFAGETLDGTPRQTWFLEQQSVCGKFKTSEMVKAWNDREWMAGNPEHPLAYMKALSENINVCIDFVKARSRTMHVIRGRGGKLGVIGPDDPRATQDLILKTLNR